MRDKIKLESSAGTGHFYTTTKNKRTTPGKFEIKKFDPVARKHVVYKETKLKYSSATLSTQPAFSAWQRMQFSISARLRAHLPLNRANARNTNALPGKEPVYCAPLFANLMLGQVCVVCTLPPCQMHC